VHLSVAERGPCRCTARLTTRCGAHYATRPNAASETLFVSLRQRRSARPEAGDLGERGRRHRRQTRRPAPASAMSAAPRTPCATRSARCWPNGAWRWRSFASSPATWTSGRRDLCRRQRPTQERRHRSTRRRPHPRAIQRPTLTAHACGSGCSARPISVGRALSTSRQMLRERGDRRNRARNRGDCLCALQRSVPVLLARTTNPGSVPWRRSGRHMRSTLCVWRRGLGSSERVPAAMDLSRLWTGARRKWLHKMDRFDVSVRFVKWPVLHDAPRVVPHARPSGAWRRAPVPAGPSFRSTVQLAYRRSPIGIRVLLNAGADSRLHRPQHERCAERA
jgi:hypothetical protein